MTSTSTPTSISIKTSRLYIPYGKLRTYWYIRYMVGAFIFYICLIPPMPFLRDFIGWPWAFVTGVIGMVWFVIFVQHAHVICWTIPKVLSQPILPDSKQPDPNEYYEIKVDQLEGIFLQAKDSGIGILAAASGSIKIQALNETAAAMLEPILYSPLLSCLSPSLVLWYLLWQDSHWQQDHHDVAYFMLPW